MAEQNHEKSKYRRKYEMLRLYNEKRITVWMPLSLLLVGGLLGLHRFYLGYIKAGIAIPVVTIAVFFIMTGFKGIGFIIWFPSAYGLLLVIEYFNISRIIDSRNAQIRDKLSKEYGL
ncbi:MAG: hypothetical protein COA91_03235 [Robiginitomaculum sp.]|nr:MAG: hypothetical protein COA91_03235 [Robiginitomaculum sp.]